MIRWEGYCGKAVASCTNHAGGGDEGSAEGQSTGGGVEKNAYNRETEMEAFWLSGGKIRGR